MPPGFPFITRNNPIKPVERNPQFSNPLVHSTSPYLKQHAHNPVYWHEWGKEALDLAKKENKPIMVSIGYSTCYWCHVMEREVFENVSIAALMNKTFINIKVDREERPELDEIYMIARQILTQEGGWPNNVFLTPDLKPFYAGGTYAPDDSYGKPAFPRLIEWLNYSWTTQESEVRKQADDIFGTMKQYLIFEPPVENSKPDIAAQASELVSIMKGYHDERSGGFFQAPKFPHECYLSFLLGYYEYSNDDLALNIVMHSLGKMAAGGVYDHVGCGFHRYAVDKEWFVPHFEKMLYNQAMLARIYTDAARFSGNEYFADIAKSILDFVSGPLTDGNGAFYSAIDAETNQIEGEFYAWTSGQIEQTLTAKEASFFVNFYALADIPAFPGHKHTEGQVIVARKPLDQAASESGAPYAELAAMTAQVMNKLLTERNQREAPSIDDKIITSWNGLMIDAYAHATKIFKIDRYLKIAERAATFLLEHAIDNEGNLCRIVSGSRAQILATLEDYSFLIKGLISLYKANDKQATLDSAVLLAARVEEKFSDPQAPGYFSTEDSDLLVIRMKGNDDSTLPCANAVMVQNWINLFELTENTIYKNKAQAMIDYFIGGSTRVMVDSAAMLEAAVKLASITENKPVKAASFVSSSVNSPDDAVKVNAVAEVSGDICEVTVRLDIKEGWYVNSNYVSDRFLIPTQIDVQGEGANLVEIIYPQTPVYNGVVSIIARLELVSPANRPPLKVAVRFQPCSKAICHDIQDMFITI